MKTKKKRKHIFLKLIGLLLAALLLVMGVNAIRAPFVYNKLTKSCDQAITPSVDFVQPGLLADFDETAYTKYFAELRAAGYDSVILQFTRYKVGGVCYSYYPSSAIKNAYENVDDSCSNVLGDLLRNAAKNNFKVWVGLSVDDDDWWGVTCYFNKEWMEALGAVDVAMIQEISDLYGDEPAFYGWYWAHELFSNPAYIEGIWAELINSSIAAINELGDGRPLMLSPFRHVQTGLVTNEYRMWHRFFEKVDFRPGDIFTPQDSMGKLNQDKPISKRSYRLIYDYLNQVKRAVDEEDGLILWVNVEFFQKENGDEYNTGNTERIKLQCANASRVTDTLVSFSMSHYGLPEFGTNDSMEKRAAFYHAFCEFAK